MQIQFSNRYNDVITITRLEEDKFLVQGGKYYRYGWDSEDDLVAKRYIFVDPSGGPYISQGMTMGYIHQPWLGKIVHYITLDDEKSDDKIIVTYPERIVQATVNQKTEYRIYSAEGEIITTRDTFNEAVSFIEQKNERRQVSQTRNRPTE